MSEAPYYPSTFEEHRDRMLQHGWRPIDSHRNLAAGARIRHSGHQWPNAEKQGTGIVLMVLQGGPHVEVIVQWDEGWFAIAGRVTVISADRCVGITRVHWGPAGEYLGEERVMAGDADPAPQELVPWTQSDGTTGRIAVDDVAALLGYTGGLGLVEDGRRRFGDKVMRQSVDAPFPLICVYCGLGITLWGGNWVTARSKDLKCAVSPTTGRHSPETLSPASNHEGSCPCCGRGGAGGIDEDIHPARYYWRPARPGETPGTVQPDDAPAQDPRSTDES